MHLLRTAGRGPARSTEQELTTTAAALPTFETGRSAAGVATGAGFSLSGAAIARVLLGPHGTASETPGTGWWRILPPEPHRADAWWDGQDGLRRSLPLLVQLADGRWAGGAALPRFVLGLTLEPAGAVAEFHAPLVKGIDPPDDTLDEDLVLIERDQRPQRARRNSIHQDGAAGPVAIELAMRGKTFRLRLRRPRGQHLGAGLVQGAARHQCLGLREAVGQQLGVMIAERIVTVDGRDEVTGDQLGALVDQLVKRMLTIRARLPPDHRTGGVVHAHAVSGDVLSVALAGRTGHVPRPKRFRPPKHLRHPFFCEPRNVRDGVANPVPLAYRRRSGAGGVSVRGVG